jgi:hypothetical protein
MNKSVADIEEAIAELSLLVPTPAEFGDRFIEAEYALKATLDTLASILSGKKAQEQLEAQNRALQAEQAAKEAEAQLAAKEQARVDGIKAKIQAIKNNIIAASEYETSAQINFLMCDVLNMVIVEPDYHEFTEEAIEIRAKTYNALMRQRDSLLQAEQEAQAEADALAKVEADRIAAQVKSEITALANNVINEADFNKVFEVKEQATRTEKVTAIKERPTSDEIVSLVARSYDVEKSVAQHWLVQSFGELKAA